MGGDRYLVVVGKVIKPHGLHGELKVISYIVKPENFQQWESVFVKKNSDEGVWLQIDSVRFQHKGVLLKFSGVNERDSAEFYRGSLLYVKREAVEELSENSYPLFQISGCMVETLSGRKIGIVEDILRSPAQNIIVVKRGRKQVLIPFVKEFVKKIDIESGRVVISPIEGLLDNAD